ncbi:hypothetical protein N9A94_02805 [Akkermansiaceae bacterium]|nr:hypothetical protein [Akkermansiaceae bacterium]
MIDLNTLSTIVFNGSSIAWLGATLAVIGAIWSLVGYRRRVTKFTARTLAPVILRMVALALLALCLAEPSLVGEEAAPGENIVAIIVDNSLGMQIRDADGKQTRSEELAELLKNPQGEEADWLSTTSDTFAMRRFSLDSRLRRVGEFQSLDFSGDSSAIGTSLDSIRRRFAGRPVAAVVLLSDGNSTDDIDLSALGDLPPIFPVVIGNESPEFDLGIRAAAVSQTSFEDSPVTIRADVQAQGYVDKRVTVRLLNSAGDEIEAKQFTPSSESDSRSLRFSHRPPTGGVHFYRIEIASDSDEEEATLVNNSRLVTLNRGSGPYRILYVSGRPNWEYKFLNRALAEDDEVDLVGLIRVARREPKFQWRGRNGVASNQLFQGLDPNDDTADTDQPVMVRLNTRDEHEFSSGFPRKPEDLFEYQAVIIDDLERAFFSVDQMDLLDTFVSRRGGSLLMLGGVESLAHGGYDKSPIGKMLPVHLGSPGGPIGSDLALDLTRDGWLSPWMRLRESEPDERKRIAAMSSFKSLNRIAAIKPGATVLARVDDQGTRRPALAAQRFGNGRVSALMIADLWRWGFSVPENRPDMEKAWRQLVRWLIADVPERVTLKLEPAGDGAVKARIEVHDEEFEPMVDARVKINIAGAQSGSEEAVELSATASDTEPGVFEVTFVPHESGATTITARAADTSDKEIGKATQGWAANGAADEFKRLEPNREFLKSIAESTGGELLEPDQLDDFAARLPKMEAPETRTWSRSLWHTPLVFLLVLGCFATEWILRRQSGMA